MRTIISTAALLAMTASASAMCLGTTCRGYGSSNLIYTPRPTVVLPCRKTPRTDAEKIGAFFAALSGVIENECDPADVRREQEAHAARMRLMEEQRQLIEEQRRALQQRQAQARPVQELPKPDRKLCRAELANPSRATRHLQVECVELYGEKP
jgi:hypothetical protein